MAQHSIRFRVAIVLAIISICLAIVVAIWYFETSFREQNRIVSPTTTLKPFINRPVIVPKSDISIEREVSVKHLLTHSLTSIAIALDGKMLVATDGYALGDGKSDVLFYQTIDLTPIKNMIVETDQPWSWPGIVLSSDKKRLLVCDREFDLTSLEETRRLVVNGVIEEGNITPVPLSVSPNDRLAVILVESFLSHDMDVLGLWDLETGKLIRKLKFDPPVKAPNALFLDNNRVVIQAYDGRIFIVNLRNNTSIQLKSKVASSPRWSGSPIAYNLSICRIGTTNLLVFCGNDLFNVIDIAKDEVVFSDELSVGNVQVLNNRDLIYQAWNLRQTKGNNIPGQAYLRIRNSTDWKIVRDINIDQYFQFFQVDQQGKTIFAVERFTDKIVKFAIPPNDDKKPQ